MSVWTGPGVLQSFDELPQCAIERRGNSELIAPANNRAVHEIDLSWTLNQNVLQHAGPMFAGRISAFVDHVPGISVQLDLHCSRYGFAFRNQLFKQLSGGRESCRCAM